MLAPTPYDESRPPKAHRVAKLVVVIALAALGLWIVARFIPALVWAGIIGIALGPLYIRAERRWTGLRRGHLLPAIFTLAVAIVVLTPIVLGVAQGAREWHNLQLFIADARTHGIPVPDWVRQLPFGADEVSRWWQENLATAEGTNREIAHLNLMSHGRAIGGEMLKRLVIFIFTLLTLFFLLKEHEALVKQLKTAGDKLLGPTGERIALHVVQAVRGTINGIVLVGIAEGVAMTVFYLIAGVPSPILVGAFTAVAAMIPFGAALMFAIASLLLVGQGAVGWAIAVFAVGMVVVGIADHWARPTLIGGATRIPFIWVLLGLIGGIECFGLLGLFVGPSTMAALMMLWRELVGTDRVALEAPLPDVEPPVPA